MKVTNSTGMLVIYYY